MRFNPLTKEREKKKKTSLVMISLFALFLDPLYDGYDPNPPPLNVREA